MKYVGVIIAILMLLPYVNAASKEISNLEWKPLHPKEGDIVTIYATLPNESKDVRFEYCVGETFCSMPTSMKYENGKWIGNFTMPKAKNVEIKILVNSSVVLQANITSAEEKHTPAFEVPLIIGSFIALLVWRKRWK